MNLREIISGLHWEPYEKREIMNAFDMYERYFKFLEITITKKIVQMKLAYPMNTRKYLMHTYDQELLPRFEPEFWTPDIVIYETVTFDLSILMEMITPVIRKHMEQYCFPMNMYRIVIGPELNQAITKGKLPETQHEFGVKPYFNIVYCPDITGIAVLP